MKKQTKRDLIYLAQFIALTIIGVLFYCAVMIGFAALVEYVLSPMLDAALWSAWEAVNSWL